MTAKRRPLVAANWKMNGSLTANEDWAASFVQKAASLRCDVVVCAPFVYVCTLGRSLAPAELGAQDVSERKAGAFTGDISAEMLADVGCRCLDILQIDASLDGGRADRDERDLGFRHCPAEVRGGEQTRSDVAAQERRQAGLMDRSIAGLDHAHLALVVVHANDLVPAVREACARNEADVATADDGDPHQAASAT